MPDQLSGVAPDFPVGQPAYPTEDGKAGAMALIQRGLDCLAGKHELGACQYYMWGIFACKHCGFILPERHCTCGHENNDVCFMTRYDEKGKPTGNPHLRPYPMHNPDAMEFIIQVTRRTGETSEYFRSESMAEAHCRWDTFRLGKGHSAKFVIKDQDGKLHTMKKKKG
jgi:hypothetical protein